MILTLTAFLVVALTCAVAGVGYNGAPTIIIIASFRSSLFMDSPLAKLFKFIFLCRGQERGMEAAAAPCALNCPSHLPFSVSHYEIGFGLGLGGRSHTSGAQGGSGGVGIRNSLPWVEAEPPDMQVPIKVARLG